MQVCHSFIILLLCGAVALTLGASIASQTAGDAHCQQRCLINRRKIMAAAKQYYKARYETKLLLLKLQVHRQQLVEKRLRYQSYLQRMRLRYKARIQRRFNEFSRKVRKAKQSLKRKLASVTKRFQRKVMRELRVRPGLSKRRMRLIKKAFFRTGSVTSRRSLAPSQSRAVRTRLVSELKKTLASPVRLTSKRITKLTRMRARMSLGEKEKMLTRMHSDLAREIERTLVFRWRVFRLRHHRRVLARRIDKLRARSHRLAKSVSTLTKRRLDMLRRMNLLAKSEKVKRDKALLAASERLAQKIARSLRSIEQLNRRRKLLKRRVARISHRRHRMSRRIRVLQGREQRQVQASLLFCTKLTTLLARWKIYGPKRFDATSRGPRMKASGSTPNSSIEPMDRPTIDRIMKKFRDQNVRMIHLVIQSVAARRKSERNHQHITKLLKRIAELSNQRRGGLERRQRLIKVATKLGSLQAKAAAVDKMRMQLSTVLFLNAMKYRKLLIRYRLLGILKSLNVSATVISKVRGRIRRRERRLKRQLKRQKRLLRRIVKSGNFSSRTAGRLIRRATRQTIRLQRKSLAKRIVKRVKRIQRRLQLEVRKVGIIKKRKLHIKHRSIRLRRRFHRLATRRQRLKKRIANLEQRRVRLASLVERLQFRKRAVRQKKTGKASAVQIKKIDAQMKRVTHKTSVYSSLLRRMKRRRIQLKIRLDKIAIRQRRLRQRLAAIQRRTRRQKRRLQRILAKKRKFVKRVAKKNLISRRKMKRIAQQNSRLEKRISGIILNSKSLCAKVIGRLPRIPARSLIPGGKVLKATQAEAAARNILRSSVQVPVKKLRTMQRSLKEKLSLLKKELATAEPALKKLVQRNQRNYQKAEDSVAVRLAKRFANIKAANKKALKKHAVIYRTEYKELLSKTPKIELSHHGDDSGWTTWTTTVETDAAQNPA